MDTQPHSERTGTLLKTIEPVIDFFMNSTWVQRAGDPEICDFVVGNPQEFPLPAFVSALQARIVPQNKDWFAYKNNEPEARELIAASLRRQRQIPFESDDIFLTNGAFAALAVTLHATTDPGDEVIFISPPWFFYETLITAAGARPVRVKCDPTSLDLDLDAIEAAITERTRGIIINSPNNPTGTIYPVDTLRRLATLLDDASQRTGRPIYLYSDEAYCRIVFDGRDFPSPTAFYPNSFLIYTYGKTLLTPGQRMGYIALPPTMPQRERMRPALFVAQLAIGFAFPNALLQHALPDIEALTIDVGQLQRRRDRMVHALQEQGYDVKVPAGTFYLLVRSPLEDDLAFLELLAEYQIFCLPGSLVELPGYFRISLTANDEMIERAIPGFAAAMEQAKGAKSAPPV